MGGAGGQVGIKLRPMRRANPCVVGAVDPGDGAQVGTGVVQLGDVVVGRGHQQQVQLACVVAFGAGADLPDVRLGVVLLHAVHQGLCAFAPGGAGFVAQPQADVQALCAQAAVLLQQAVPPGAFDPQPNVAAQYGGVALQALKYAGFAPGQAGVAVAVQGHEVVAAHDAFAGVVGQAQAQLDVFKAVEVVFVKAASAPKFVAAAQQHGPGDGRHGLGGKFKFLVTAAAQGGGFVGQVACAVGSKAHAKVLHLGPLAAIGQLAHFQQFEPDGTDVALLQGVDHGGQCILLPDDVVVQEQQVGGAGTACAQVAGGGEGLVFLQGVDVQGQALLPLLQYRQAVVGAGMVHHDPGAGGGAVEFFPAGQ